MLVKKLVMAMPELAKLKFDERSSACKGGSDDSTGALVGEQGRAHESVAQREDVGRSGGGEHTRDRLVRSAPNSVEGEE